MTGGDCGSQIRHFAPHRRRAWRSDRRARREQLRRAGGAARRRQDHARAAGAARRAVGAATRRSWCWSRAGWPRAPPPRAWRRRWASRSAKPSACACASAPRSPSARASRWSPRACSRGSFSTIPSLDGVAAVLFDEFHERSLDADLGLALARDAQQGLREDLKLLVMSATLDGARVAALARRRAGDREPGPRLSGRDALSRPRSARAHREPGRRCGRARAARGAGLGAGVPARRRRNPPRRDAAQGARRAIRPSISSRSTARSMRASRTAPSRRRRRAAARSCWRPRSPRPRSPSRACASSSTAGSRACRATSPTSA